MGKDIIEYFKEMAEESGVPYQSLIDLCLRDCVVSRRKLDVQWAKQGASRHNQ